MHAWPAQSLAAAAAPSTPTPHPSALTLDHQQRFFTGWGDTPPSSHTADPAHDPNLKTPSLGLVWANQIACRIALVKEAAYLRPGDPTNATHETSTVDPESAGLAGAVLRVRACAGKAGDLGPERAEWAPRAWRRWMRVVFAPWVGGVRAGGRGVEFEVWRGGVRGVRGGDG